MTRVLDRRAIGARILLVFAIVLCAVGCKRPTPAVLVAPGSTFAEMRTVKGSVTVTPPGETVRAPYPRERLADGDVVSLAEGALAWVRRDAGAVWLVDGPARLTVHEGAFALDQGRAFVDTEDGPPVLVDSPRGRIELSDARASVDARADGAVDVYVLRGSARAEGAERAGAGEQLSLVAGPPKRTPSVAWDDWTGGLATADPAAEPAPFGIGTVGARPPGDKGKPRFPLVVQRLDVKVTVDRDFAVTEVDETFVNPSAETVEGIFSFRTPPGAVLQRFGVDRNGDLVWGRIKESAAARAQYESNVYQGSTEDPALLQWMAPGVYNARLYPIQRGAQRRVVTRYAEWLPRQGPLGERRLYVYPMAAEGARASLPRIEELTVTLDLARAGAQWIRSGMGGKREGDHVIIKAFDFVPRADLSVELFDSGQPYAVAYRAPHALGPEEAPVAAETDYAKKVSREEPDYILVPLRSPAQADAPPGVDLAIVVDTSAATESSALAVARNLASALLAHLGPEDRAALWAGDATLRPVADGSGALTVVDKERRRAWLAGLASVEKGGATDIGALLTDAANALDPKRRGAIVYIGDGLPSVGEIAPKALRERLARLPQATRVLAAGLGSRANMGLLRSVARGAPAELVGDAYDAARVALRLLEAAQRPAWLGASVDLGPTVERVLPRDVPPVGADEGVLVVGRVTGRAPPTLTLKGSGGSVTKPLRVMPLADFGDLRRRWGEDRMTELLEEGAGRAALVDVGRRFGVVSPVTSLYVPTTREQQEAGETSATLADLQEAARDRRWRWKPWRSDRRSAAMGEIMSDAADMKEGGTGTRAKGEEGSMGNPNTKSTPHAYGVQGPRDNSALQEAAQFGMIGLIGSKLGGDPNAPSPPGPPRPDTEAEKAEPPAAWGRSAPAEDKDARGNMFGGQIGDSFGATGLGLSGAGEAGGGRGEGIDLAKIAAPSNGAEGQRRMAAAHAAPTPPIKDDDITANGGRLAPEVIRRIVRQNFGRFRLCYENGLKTNPALAGHVKVKFVIGKDGAVATASDGGSDLPSRDVVACVVRGFNNLSFPQPENAAVQVQYPITFGTGVSAPAIAPPVTAPLVTAPLASIGHVAHPCGPGADLSFDERRVLWRERLAGIGWQTALDVYHFALSQCEAPTWRERYALLIAMVDSLESVQNRVSLWRSLMASPEAQEVVYRAILLRVQTPADLRQLHDALGLKSVDPDLLGKMLAKAKTPRDRLGVLRGAAKQWPDDLELALRTLDAYEDAGDDAGGRAWARRLRSRPDATAHVYTSVGEYYLRLAPRQQGNEAERDVTEGRRTFGELVEFAPDDPVARRRLGDILRAHGWHEEAFRQYETLAQLTPDDASVPLLLATAAQGMGRIEEAVGWAEKAATAGSPDGSSPLSQAARATASAFLAWARQAAAKAGKQDDADKLRARAKRLAGGTAAQPGSVRFIVTWSHPELHPALWTSALGAMMPAADNFPLFGVAEAAVPSSPPPLIELRLDPEDAARAARLGVTVVVTALVDEGTPGERIDRRDVSFGGAGAPLEKVRVVFDGGSLREAP
jgi:Ca-activated chloride channel family protein